MFRTLVRTYAVITALFVLALALFFIGRLSGLRDQNINQAASSFQAYQAVAVKAVEEADTAAETKELLNPEENGIPRNRLEALLLYTVDNGVAYLWARSPAYTEGGFTGGSGLPRMEYNELTQRKYTAPVGESYILEGLYTVLGREDIYPLLRVSLIAILAVALLGTVLALAGTGGRSAAMQPDPVGDSEKPRDRSEEELLAETRAYTEGPSSLTGPSGLSREEHLLKRLSLELERAAYNEQDLTVLMVEYAQQEPYNENYLRHASQLLEHFGFDDLAFEKGNRFVVIFPSTTLREGLRQVERFQKELLDSGPTTEDDHPYAGLSSRNGRLLDGKRLLAEATVALNKSYDTPGRILGFEPDPEKYRAAL